MRGSRRQRAGASVIVLAVALSGCSGAKTPPAEGAADAAKAHALSAQGGGSAVMAEVPVQQAGQATAKPKSPLTATTAECIDDVWLLSHFSVADLIVDKAHHAVCCKPGVLLGTKHAHWCELDWPSSDVPGCALWGELRDKLSARFAEADRSELVRQNLQTLASHTENRFQCEP